MCLENYDNVLALADKYVLGDLRFDIFKFIGDNFTTLADKDKFLHLSHDLFYLLLAEEYNIEATEYFVFQTVMKWVHHDPKEREKYMVDILLLIRFLLFEPEELSKIPPEVSQVPELRELIDEAKAFHEEPHRQCLMTSERTEVRGGQEAIMAISAIDDANLIQYKLPRLPGFFSEEVCTNFLNSVFEFSQVTVLGNYMYVAGGYDRHSWCSSPDLYRYNPRNRSWTEMTPMTQPRVSFALCSSDKGIYAVAGIEHIVHDGQDRENILKTGEFYDPEIGLWTTLPLLPHGSFSTAAAFCRNTLFVSGGINDDPEDNVPVNYLRTYVPGQESWVLMAPMLTERQGHAMVTFGDKLFVLGGYHSGADTVSFDHCLKTEVYDVELNQWTQLKDFPGHLGHVHSSSAVLNNKIYIIGGRHASRFLGAFNPETNELEDMEYCGEHVLKIATVRLAFPNSVE